jgi:hypothetical protein
LFHCGQGLYDGTAVEYRPGAQAKLIKPQAITESRSS